MSWTKLWCAGKLGNCKQLTRFHFSCLFCRWRRAFYGHYTDPPYWIQYVMRWTERNVWLNPRSQKLHAKSEVEVWRVDIDPRGHFVMARCAAIMVIDALLTHFPRLEKPLIEFCSFLSCHPII